METIGPLQSLSPSGARGSDALQVLDLTESEEAVVNSLLEHGRQSVSKLSRTSDVPRTTVHAVLARLCGRQLVRRVSEGYASVWELVPAERIQGEFKSSLGYLDRDISTAELERAIGAKTAENKEFFVFSGIDAMFHVYQWLMLNHFHQSVCRIQPYTAAAALFGRVHPKQVSNLCDVLKDNKITLTFIMSDKAHSLYTTALESPTRYTKQLAEHVTAAHVVPETVLPFEIELVLGNDVALVMDWKAQNLVLIKHSGMVKMLHGFTSALVYIAGNKNASDVHYAS